MHSVFEGLALSEEGTSLYVLDDNFSTTQVTQLLAFEVVPR